MSLKVKTVIFAASHFT